MGARERLAMLVEAILRTEAAGTARPEVAGTGTKISTGSGTEAAGTIAQVRAMVAEDLRVSVQVALAAQLARSIVGAATGSGTVAPVQPLQQALLEQRLRILAQLALQIADNLVKPRIECGQLLLVETREQLVGQMRLLLLLAALVGQVHEHYALVLLGLHALNQPVALHLREHLVERRDADAENLRDVARGDAIAELEQRYDPAASPCGIGCRTALRHLLVSQHPHDALHVQQLLEDIRVVDILCHVRLLSRVPVNFLPVPVSVVHHKYSRYL